MATRNARSRRLGTATLLLALALAGCGGQEADDDAAELPHRNQAEPIAEPREGSIAGVDGEPPAGASGGVALIYHHVSGDTPPSTSVTPERFREQLDYLAAHDFEVWPLPRLIEAARNDEPIPPRTVAITFDDAYRSVYTEAFPELRERGWPFTVFVATDAVGRHAIYSDWDELREMEDAGATLANHSVSHPHMARARVDEDETDWLARMEREILDAQARLDEELAEPARMFAWPYGESSPPVRALLREHGFTGFGQQSGAIGPASHDFAALPRFPIATAFADLDDFARKVRTRPLPVTATEPDSGVLGPDTERPRLTLTLDDGPFRPAAVACFAGGRPIETERVGDDPPRLRVRADQPLAVGRTHYTCTAPATDGDYFLWFTFVWMKPYADGRWYDE